MRIDHQNRQVAPLLVYIGIYIDRCLGALLRGPFGQVLSVVAYLSGKLKPPPAKWSRTILEEF